MEAESKNSKLCVKYIPQGTHTQEIRSLPIKMTTYLTDYENVAEPPTPLYLNPLVNINSVCYISCSTNYGQHFRFYDSDLASEVIFKVTKVTQKRK